MAGERRARRVPPRFIALTGVALTLLLFVAGYYVAWQQYRKQFLSDASLRAMVVIDSLRGRLLELDGLQRYLEEVERVDRERFRGFVQPSLNRQGIQAAAWIPVAPGYDLDPDRLAALRQADTTGQPTATGRIRLIQEQGEPFGFLVFLPVRGAGGQTRGFVQGLFRAGDMLTAAIRSTASLELNSDLTDCSAPHGQRLLHRFRVSEEVARQLPGLDDLLLPLPRYSKEFPFAGRRWEISCEATRGYHAESSSLIFILILPAGLLITRLGYLYSRQLERTREEAEALVAVRTAELAATNGTLLGEIEERIRTEGELRESRGEFQAFFERNGSIILLIDPTTDAIIDANDAAERFYGYSRESLRTMRYGELLRWAYPSAAETDPALEHQHAAIQLHRLAHGEFRTMQAHSSFIERRYAPGTGVLFVILHDISANQKMADAQKLHQLHLGIAMDLARLAYWEFNNETGLLLFDDRCYALYATTAAQEGGYTLTLAEYLLRFVHPDDAESVAQAFAPVTEPHGELSRSLEYRILRRDGESRHLAVSFNPGESEMRLYGATQDITELKQARQRLEEEARELALSRNHMQTILDNLPMLAWLKDTGGRFLMVNRQFAAAVGRPCEEIIGRTSFDVWPKELAEYYHAVDREIMATGRGWSADEEIADVRGAAWFEARKAPITAADGAILGTTGIARNITRRRQNEQLILNHQRELEELNAGLGLRIVEEIARSREKDLLVTHREKLASIGQLAAGLAHEINTPLGYVTGNIQAFRSYFNKLSRYLLAQDELLSTAATEAQRRELSTLAHALDIEYLLEDVPALIAESLHGAERVSRIVRDLKSFSRVDAPAFQEADLTECMESALSILTHELKDVAVVEKEYQQLPYVQCQPGELNQLFLNLLLNAGQALTPVGRISLKSWYDDLFVYASVADNGSGIPDELQGKIFEPFFTTKEVGKGTGLGLSVCHDIITKHHGELRLESVVGIGSTFTVKLPRSEAIKRDGPEPLT